MFWSRIAVFNFSTEHGVPLFNISGIVETFSKFLPLIGVGFGPGTWLLMADCKVR
jgi:hypothetical protein